MSLTLTVLSFKNQPINEIQAVVIDKEGSIGRSNDNTLVLPDTERFVSRHHATIKLDSGSYYLTDTSLSGVSIDAEISLHNETERLSHGMRLKIGEYEIAVTITQQPVIDDLPFLAESLTPEPVPLFTVDEPWLESDNLGLNSLMSDNFPLHEELVQSTTETSTPNFESHLHANQSPLFDSYVAPSVADSPLGSVEKIPENFSFDDLFASTEPPINQTNDFEDTFAAALAGFEPVTENNTPPVDIGSAVRNVSEIEDAVENNPLFAVNPLSVSEPEIAPPLKLNPSKSDFIPDDTPVKTNSFTIEQPQPVSEPITPSLQAIEAKPSADRQLFDAFLQGVATDCKTIHPEQQADTLRNIGQMFRKLIEGTVAVLRSRAEFKSLCRVNMTVIKATDNNPLKFTVSSDDVLRQLLENKADGFLASTDAIEQAFNDIMNHQLAMQAGIQASLTDLLQTFDPKLIEKQFEQGLVLQKKSKCWDSYGKTYQNTVDNAVENFFGDAFVKAYEQQMSSLTRSRKK